ncbi:hypothetical protein PAEVO_20890 [Paenibacillus sp. GM2FR]|nr:hypothetical protein PAEVO_20890 [Paenibacillus sp. GM2FR]
MISQDEQIITIKKTAGNFADSLSLQHSYLFILFTGPPGKVSSFQWIITVFSIHGS